MNYSGNKRKKRKNKKMVFLLITALVTITLSTVIISLAIRNSKLNSELMHVEAMAAEIVPEEETTEPVESTNPYKSIKMADYEMDYLERILALEAQGEPFEGQVAVVEVIFNRVLSDEYPDSVYKVLSQDGQFCSWKYLENPYNVPNQTQKNAIKFAIEHGPTVIPMHCYEEGLEAPERYVFFATYEANGSDFFQIGNHYFGKG